MPPTPILDVGDLWLVNFGPPVPGEAAGVHPALIVAPQSPLIRNSAIPVSVVPLTSKQRPRMSTRVAIDPTDVSGLTDESYAQCEYVQPVSRSRLIQRIGEVDPIIVTQVLMKLQFWFNIPTTGGEVGRVPLSGGLWGSRRVHR